MLEDKNFPFNNLICERKNNNSRQIDSASCDIKFFSFLFLSLSLFLGTGNDINSYFVR